jgi:Protein of unknown function (DUF3592)
VVLDRSTLVRVNRVMGILSLAVGLALLVGAVFWSAHHLEFVSSAAAVRGEVVANVKKEWTDQPAPGASVMHHRSYCAVVHYVDLQGVARIYQDAICFSPASFRIGDSVTIRYDPQKPASVMIDRGEKFYIVPLAIAIVGVLCVSGGVWRLTGRGLPPVTEAMRVPIIRVDPTGSSYRRS